MDIWWSSLGSAMAIFAFFRSYLPPELTFHLLRLYTKLFAYFSNYVYTTVEEFQDSGSANELFASIHLYLSALPKSSSTKSVNAFVPKKSSKVALNMDRRESIRDTYQGISLRWDFMTVLQKPRAASTYAWLQPPQKEEEVRKFILRIHRQHRSTLLQPYLNHITEQAKSMKQKNKERSLYTNISSSSSAFRGKPWLPVAFKHPASFQTLALDSELKQSIIDDLTRFAKGGEFYKRAGRAWKRGYLLYGPPGTGKTSMIAAIANFLGYDVYDLELTQVESNSELRELLLNTTDKSVIVIEDIDCTLDLSERSKKKEKDKVENSKNESESKNKEVTLSGLLNFTDGILSCCSRERIIVFTTNHVEKLDPALLRSGRMDLRIHLSFCTFEGVKVLVRNYLQIEDHPLFPAIELAIAGAKMSPAAISEVLTMERRNPDGALQALLLALEENKKPPPVESQKEEEEEEGEARSEKKEEEQIKGEAIVNKKANDGEEKKSGEVSEDT